MTGAANVTRGRYYRYVRTIRIQRVVILLLLVLLVISVLPSCRVQANQLPTKSADPVTPEIALVTALEPEDALTLEPTTEPTEALILLGEFKLTAYCSCEKCCGKSVNDPYYGITASGTIATAGRTVAVDPTVIPIGSEVVINDHTYIAEDVGGAIKENRIDVYFNSHEEALEFGVQYADVYLTTNNL